MITNVIEDVVDVLASRYVGRAYDSAIISRDEAREMAIELQEEELLMSSEQGAVVEAAVTYRNAQIAFSDERIDQIFNGGYGSELPRLHWELDAALESLFRAVDKLTEETE